MLPIPNPSILHARGVGIRDRAERLATRAEHPFTRSQIELVRVAVQDAMAWLQEPEQGNTDRLQSIDDSLRAQAERLDELEDLLRAHGGTTDSKQ